MQKKKKKSLTYLVAHNKLKHASPYLYKGDMLPNLRCVIRFFQRREKERLAWANWDKRGEAARFGRFVSGV